MYVYAPQCSAVNWTRVLKSTEVYWSVVYCTEVCQSVLCVLYQTVVYCSTKVHCTLYSTEVSYHDVFFIVGVSCYRSRRSLLLSNTVQHSPK